MRSIHLVVLLAAMACAASASAAERKAYKYVDEQGNVTYSQTPPANKDAKAVSIAPAHQGRGGYPSSAPPVRASGYDDRGRQSMQDYQRRQEDARQQKTQRLRSECIRQRGTDCDNPDTLRDMDSQSIPFRR